MQNAKRQHQSEHSPAAGGIPQFFAFRFTPFALRNRLKSPSPAAIAGFRTGLRQFSSTYIHIYAFVVPPCPAQNPAISRRRRLFRRFLNGFTPLETMMTKRNPSHSPFGANKKFLTGFTLIETIVVIAVIGMIGTFAIASFTNSRRIRDLTASGQNMLSVLGVAQSHALAGDSSLPWGVRLEPSRFTLFSGSSFAGSTMTTVYNLPAGVEIANVTLAGGGTDVLFRRLDGRTGNTGTFVVRIAASPGQTFPITIDASGRTYRTGTAPVLTGTRVADTRHRNFTLGWSIEDSITMTLTFSNPPGADVVVPVVMTPVTPRATYDWSGTTVVGGVPQVLRLHALSITGSNTVLSADRDCRKNTKKLVIAIDAKTIATYEANCTTVTVGAFGGTMVEP